MRKIYFLVPRTKITRIKKHGLGKKIAFLHNYNNNEKKLKLMKFLQFKYVYNESENNDHNACKSYIFCSYGTKDEGWGK